MIRQIKTVAGYDSLKQQQGVVVMHFGFDWNSFDRTMQRTLFELQPEFGETVSFGFVDVDNNATVELLKQINLVNVPTLVYFFNGKQQAIEVGMKPMDEIRTKINMLLSIG
ncbi:MAG: thioredoxin family protein [Pyrinomonadaceae bacterium]